MELSIQKFRYENLDFGKGFSAKSDAIALAQAEVENAKKLAEQIAEEMKPVFTYNEEELETLKQKVFAEGKIIGAEEARAENEKQKQEEDFRVEELLGQINAKFVERAEIGRADAAAFNEKLKILAFAAAKKIIGEIDLVTTGKIEQWIDLALADLGNETDVEVLLNPQTLRKLEAALANKKFAAKLVADDSILVNDLKIMWKNGYAERKLDELWKQIGQIISAGFNSDEFAPKDDIEKETYLKEEANQQSEDENGR